MKYILVVIFLLSLFLTSFTNTYAIENPLNHPNNPIGIHITDKSDLEDASHLVNSNGDWGYVTVVIRDDQMDKNAWQETFDQMRRLHLIPIIRIATHQVGNNWAVPNPEDARIWAEFLHSLNWVTKNRYVVLFNEPNRASEWGGRISPIEYSQVVKAYRQELKRLSDDFFVLPAGLDMSAQNSTTTRSGERFFDQMYSFDPEVFSYFDGYVSHPYPSQGIDSFKQEISYLEKYKLNQNTPIFITETGWRNSATDIVKEFENAYKLAWRDPRIVAITPFILNYTGKPFEDFSWTKSDGGFTPQYEFVKNMSKTKGLPAQITRAELLDNPLPTNLITDSHYLFELKIKNTGQSIWAPGDIKIKLNSSLSLDTIKISGSSGAEPFQVSIVPISLTTPKNGKVSIKFEVFYKDEKIIDTQINTVELIPPISLKIFTPLAFKMSHDASDANLYIYDDKNVIKEINNLSVTNNTFDIKELYDVVPNKLYRFVVTKPGYLPRQTFGILDKEMTIIKFAPLLPLDPDMDGNLSVGDLIAFIGNPRKVIFKILPF